MRTGGDDEELRRFREQIKEANRLRSDVRARRDEIHQERRNLVLRKGDVVQRPNLRSMESGRRATGSGTIQSPLQIPGLVGWYSAKQITGLSDGQAVAQWNDLSGKGNHFIQNTGAAQPTYRLVNGVPYVSCTTATKQMIASLVTAKTTISAFAVWRFTGVTDGYQVMAFNGGAADGTSLVEVSQQQRRDVSHHNVSGFQGLPMPINQWELWAVTDDGSAPNLAVNGIDHMLIRDTVGSANMSVPTTGTALAAGTAGGLTYPVIGDIAELIIVERNIGSSERRGIEGYLRYQWSPLVGAFNNVRSLAVPLAGDLLLQLDASQLSLADTTPIVTWPDLSGNGYDAYQAITTRQPALRTAVQNGLNVARFNGTTHYLHSIFPNLVQPFTVALVMKLNSTAANQVAFDTLNSSPGTPALFTTLNTWNLGTITATADSAWHVILCVVNGVSSILRIDAAETSGDGGTGFLWAGLNIGINRALAGPISADVGELRVLRHALTSGERGTLQAALKTKWGTP